MGSGIRAISAGRRAPSGGRPMLRATRPSTRRRGRTRSPWPAAACGVFGEGVGQRATQSLDHRRQGRGRGRT
jgi:hypothetical protein